jgi:hypothetical protein
MAVFIGGQSAIECFALFDERMRLDAATGGRVKDNRTVPVLKRAGCQTRWRSHSKGRVLQNTVEEVAMLTGVNAAGFRIAIANYNCSTESGAEASKCLSF